MLTGFGQRQVEWAQQTRAQGKPGVWPFCTVTAILYLPGELRPERPFEKSCSGALPHPRPALTRLVAPSKLSVFSYQLSVLSSQPSVLRDQGVSPRSCRSAAGYWPL